MHYVDFQYRPSVLGTIRWPKKLGKPLGVPLERGLRVTYTAVGGSLPSSGILGMVSRRCLTMSEPNDGDEHIVYFWGPDFVDLRAAVHWVIVEFAEGVQWEPLPAGYGKRQINPGARQFTADSAGEIEPFTISAPMSIVPIDPKKLALTFAV